MVPVGAEQTVERSNARLIVFPRQAKIRTVAKYDHALGEVKKDRWPLLSSDLNKAIVEPMADVIITISRDGRHGFLR